nr:MFS transporter [Lolliginicoccus suaedae]
MGNTRTSGSHQHAMRQIHVLVAAAFVIAVGYGLIAPVLPQYASSFNVGYTAASAIVSIFAVARLLFAPASGQLVQKLGERRIYLSGLVIVAVSTGASAAAQSYWQLMVFRGLGGIGSTMFTISAMALIIRLSPPDRRGKVSSLYSTAFLLGGITGPLLGGLLGRFGLRVPFIVYTVALVIAIIVVRTRLDAEAGGKGSARSAPRREYHLGEALREPAYRAALLTNLAHGWATFGVRVALIPLFVTVAFTMGTELGGFALAAFSIGMAIVLTTSGKLSDRIGRKPPTIMGLAITGSSTMVLGLPSNPVVFLVLCVIAGAGMGFVIPSQQAAVADLIGSDRNGGKVLAAFQMTADLGAIVGPLLGGWIAENYSFEVAFLLTGALLLLAAVYWIVVPETSRAQDAGDRSDAAEIAETGNDTD